ncbi:MAG: riboflavin synthase [Candidatus Cloacimonetes bacterium]|nr:riboflavin synthase [Candidatus Cloacimonadota bacterium]
MFTGIIEEIGTIESFRFEPGRIELRIRAEKVLEDTKVGDSIAVNGICLTVTSLDSKGFTADVMPVSLEKSSLKDVGTGGKVNLERALQLQSRMGGHIVNGHIDGVGIITNIERNDNAMLFTISTNSEVLNYLIPEGSVAVDGISLTVAELRPEGFVVSLIPTTLSETILQYKNRGEQVNLESDIIGKYLWHFSKRDSKSKGISAAFLAENGFL